MFAERPLDNRTVNNSRASAGLPGVLERVKLKSYASETT
jgi:hypothetical protein